ncbi:MAG TPA: dienelactone hydrolase family protein [Caulobacteraceae bacterium]|jgi:dienelactone hydrolase|nr:dienelactone hydrolase family protein [Caulobacteraceae bacterium]
MKTQDIEYHADGARLVGYLAVDDARPGKRPGIIVAHEGGGLADHAKNCARRLAEAGYVAFALDYYGDGQPLADLSQAMPRITAWMGDPTGIRARAHAALAILTAQAETDTTRLAGIGYCFGGTTVLEMARAGEPLKAVVGFHSGLGTARPAQEGAVKAKLLVQIGAADPIIPPEQRAAFEAEMTAAKVDWRMIVYGGAGHSFTNPAVAALGRPGFAYDKSADERSWRAMLDFFGETLA